MNTQTAPEPAHATANSVPTTSEARVDAGWQIAGLLVQNGFITQEQLNYAVRVQGKLPRHKILLHVLKDLHVISDAQIQETLRERRLSIPLGTLLVELGYIKESDLRTALGLQKEKPGLKLGRILVDNHLISEAQLLEVLSMQLGFERIALGTVVPEADLIHEAPVRWLKSNDLIPVCRRDGKVVVAFVDPLDTPQVQAAKGVFGSNLIAGIALRSEIHEALDRVEASRVRASATPSESAVVQLVNQIITDAADTNASDIHIEPFKDQLRIRLRKDGVLVNYKELPSEMSHPLSNRIKILCQADIAEKRRHQDGHILFDYLGTPLDIRVSTYVTIHGETIVMRLLNNRSSLLDIRDVGMAPKILQRYVEDVLDTPSGVVLVTGPTGSGKTTTLYASINYLNNPRTSIITAEDPVEYEIKGISQCSINPKINLTYEDTLKHIVRQDPDVIVIGEIRDVFSAETAIQAALTGHKVLTTFHTEDSIGGLIRLLNMNIEAFLISSTVVCVVAQRLLRRLCPSCAEPHKLTPQEIRRFGYDPREVHSLSFMVGRGCSRCNFMGYNGRVAVFEMLVLSEMVKDAILGRKTSYEIRRISLETAGLVSMLEDAIYKATQGQTTYEEIIRMVPRLIKPRPISELTRLIGAKS